MSQFLREVAERLVAFDTVSAKSDVAAVEYLADRLDSCGFRTTVHRYRRAGLVKANLVASAGPPTDDGLIVSGHVDVVPFEGQPGWERDPLRLAVEDAAVYGRGASDMKVFLAQCVEAASRLERSRLARPLVFVFTGDEEDGCYGAAELAPALRGIVEEEHGLPLPGLAWIGEPTSYQVFHAHKSIVLVEIVVGGRGGHSGLPHLGVNAIRIAGRVIEVLGRYQEELRERWNPAFESVFPESPYTTLNLGTIAGGTADNMIADRCRITLSYRSLPDLDPLEPYREVIRRIAEIDPCDPSSPGLRGVIDVAPPFAVPPLLSKRGTRLEKTLCDLLGRDDVRGALFATDGCRLATVGIETSICGPGDVAQAHRPNESISRAAFETGTGFVSSVIERMCASARA